MSHIHQTKCDRCGAVEDWGSDKTLKWNSVRARRGCRRQKDGSVSSGFEIDADLCAPCADGLSEWLGEAAKWRPVPATEERMSR
jgi:hypothetical protein